jgi:acyl-CoA thioesterase-1
VALRDNLVAMIRASARAGARSLLIGMRIPPNYGQAYTRQFESVFAEVARAQRVPLIPFLLDGFADQRELFQQDGIHPAEQAQGLILATVWSALEPLLRARMRPRSPA